MHIPKHCHAMKSTDHCHQMEKTHPMSSDAFYPWYPIRAPIRRSPTLTHQTQTNVPNSPSFVNMWKNRYAVSNQHIVQLKKKNNKTHCEQLTQHESTVLDTTILVDSHELAVVYQLQWMLRVNARACFIVPPCSYLPWLWFPSWRSVLSLR